MANDKKKSRKKAEKKSAKDRTDVEVQWDPNDPVWKLAQHSKKKGKKALRKAFVVADFDQAFEEALAQFPDELSQLSAQEREFCKGWLFLARLVCFDEDAGQKVDDSKLVELIKNQMSPPWPHSGAG